MQRIAKLHNDVVDDRRKSSIADQRKQKGVNRSVPMSVWNSNNLMRLEGVENATDGLAGVSLYLRDATQPPRRPEQNDQNPE